MPSKPSLRQPTSAIALQNSVTGEPNNATKSRTCDPSLPRRSMRRRPPAIAAWQPRIASSPASSVTAVPVIGPDLPPCPGATETTVLDNAKLPEPYLIARPGGQPD